MLDLVNAADKEGLVLQPENTKSPLFVCCCCGCCCNVLTSAKRFPRPAEYFKVLPNDTQALYGRLLLERGPWGMTAIVARKLLGKKI